MQEEKWCVLEQFRVRPQWQGRLQRERPEVFERFVRGRLELMQAGAHALGPFRVESGGPEGDANWLNITWEFVDRETAEKLLMLWKDPEFAECLEVRFQQGHKHEPIDTLPGF